MKIICTPTKDMVNAGFTYDLVNLIKYTPDALFALTQGTILPNLRELLVKTVIEKGASHILFIDSDMRFPFTALNDLVERNVDIIGANCKQRTINQWTARKDGKFISSAGKGGIEEVDTIGMGVTLIKISVFEKLIEPYFSTPWDNQEKKHIGEDVYFCEMARQSGFKIFIDHDLSQKVKHAGLVEFGL